MQVDSSGNVTQQWSRIYPSAESLEAWFNSMVNSLTTVPKKITPPKYSGGSQICQIIIGDPHAGMYAWAEETGDNYDLSIFETMHIKAVMNLIDRSGPVKEVILTWLGDLFHSDTKQGTSQSGHIFDMDGRMGQVHESVERVVNTVIEYAANKAKKVTCLFVPGNHDPISTMWIQRLTAAWWRKSPHIEVPIFRKNRHYITRGQCLLGAYHGNRIPSKQLALQMATEAADWSTTRHRFYDCGHIHNSVKVMPMQDTEEAPGCIVEYHRVLAGLEAYGAEAGYSAARAMTARLLCEKHGEVGRLTVTPAMIME
jgi:hypothetical protein